MFDFIRPVSDPTLRIMIPEKSPLSGQFSSGQEESANEIDENDKLKYHENSNKIDFLQSAISHSAAAASRVHRQYKAFTVMQRFGFQHTEYVQIITHLCKAEILISMIFLIHGLSCPGFPNESAYQGTCHINVLAALVGIFTGGMGLGAVHKFRWKTVLVMWLIMCIISSVANLLAVITTGVWLDHLSKLKTRTGIANGLSGMMLLGSVLVGVCFILTAVLICHYWASTSTKYQAVGKIAKRTRSLRRRASRVNSNGLTNTANLNERSRLTSSGNSYNNGNFNRHYYHSPLAFSNYNNNFNNYNGCANTYDNPNNNTNLETIGSKKVYEVI